MSLVPSRRCLALLGALLLLPLSPLSPLSTSPASALDLEWADSQAEDVAAKTADALLVRPLSCLRFVASVVLFVPAAIVALPGGGDNVKEVYDTLVESSVDYAFRRKLGEL